MKRPLKRTLVMVGIMVAYIFSALLWWSYLLYDKNETAFEDKSRLNKMIYNHRNGLPEKAKEYYKTESYEALKEDYESQNWMILGEGFVFLVLLVLGTIQLWRSLYGQMALSRLQNNFMLSITHELKSPIAAIKLSLQTISKRANLADNYQNLVNNSLEDVDRLDDLVGNILLAAKLDSHSFKFNKELEDVTAVVHALVEKIQRAHKHDVTIQVHAEGEILLDTDNQILRSVIHNLIDNAIKYSPKDGKVDVRVFNSEKNVIIEVCDEGVGIPDEEKENVFRKFYRVGNEETRNTKGTGLGLYIVRKMMSYHGGQIELIKNKPTGTVVKLIFPITE